MAGDNQNAKQQDQGNGSVNVEELTNKLAKAEEVITDLNAKLEESDAKVADLESKLESASKKPAKVQKENEKDAFEPPKFYNGKAKGSYFAARMPQYNSRLGLRFEVDQGVSSERIGKVELNSWLDVQLRNGTIVFRPAS